MSDTFHSSLQAILNAMEAEAVEQLISKPDESDQMRGRVTAVREIRDNVIPAIIAKLTKE